jgi:18S rRNA (adenine1779-N6/adenine1780-N6)-dimethyltransferase
MFQREFAQRLVARPGEPMYGRLAANAQFWSRITHILKVGRNNFRPPPQVESSVVRVEPKVGAERPTISWDEWDGLLRVCFGRKNKTLRASWLGTRSVMDMVEKNYVTWCAMNDIPVDHSPAEVSEDHEAMQDAGEEEEEWGGIMEDDAAEGAVEDDAMELDDRPSLLKDMEADRQRALAERPKSQRVKTKVGVLVREKVRRVLEDITGLADQRANKCDQNDFLKLLLAFNQENIHFA